METNLTIEQLWTQMRPIAHGQLLEYKQLWDSMFARCVTPCQVSWFRVGTDAHLVTKIFKNEFMLVATYLQENSCHSSAHYGLMRNIFESWLKRGVPDLSALLEADRYLAFLQTYVRIESVDAHDIPGVAELSQNPSLPSIQRHHESFPNETNTSAQHGTQMLLGESPRPPTTDSVTPRPWVEPVSASGSEYIDNSDQFFPAHTTVFPSFLFAGYQEKWTCMARASAGLPYLMHMHCPETGARLATLKFTSALALMTAYLGSFSRHPELWWYSDEFMRHYLDMGDVNPQPTLDYMRNTISPSKPVVVAISITE